MASQYQITSPVEGIACFAFNSDRTMIALCPNNNEIHVYDCKSSPWVKLHTLTEHDMLVSSIDWCPVYNRLVSCSHDRNAFVWTYEPGTADSPAQWRPCLVLLRVDRAALDVKWSHDGLRFACTSGSKCVPVCHYEPDNDWWVSSNLKKKFKSTVLCCAFHPKNGQILATGCADFKCRVFSTFKSAIDGTNFNAGPFGTPIEFGEPYVEMSSLGWVVAVAWSPSGDALAFAGHDSTLHVARFSPSGPVVQTLRNSFLPLNKLLFLSEKALVGAGHDMNPVVFTSQSQGPWSFLQFLDEKKSQGSAASEEASGGVAAARALFKNKSTRGIDSKQAEDGVAWTQHESAIVGLASASPLSASASAAGKVTSVATCAMDGRIVVWDLSQLSLSVSLAALGL